MLAVADDKFADLRKTQLEHVDGYILCYDVNNYQSFKNLKNKVRVLCFFFFVLRDSYFFVCCCVFVCLFVLFCAWQWYDEIDEDKFVFIMGLKKDLRKSPHKGQVC